MEEVKEELQNEQTEEQSNASPLVSHVTVAVRIKPVDEVSGSPPTIFLRDSRLVLRNPSQVKLDALGIPRYKQINTYSFDYMFD